MLTRIFRACQDDRVEFKLEHVDDRVFIIPATDWVAGEGDTSFKEIVERLRKEGRKRLVVDLSNVTYMDSSALGQLVLGYSILKKAGGELKLLKPSRRIIDLLTLTRLLTVFEVYQSREEMKDSGPS